MPQKHLLVVDDEVDICEILQFNLEAEGYDVDVAHSAEEVLAMQVEKYDLILLDVMMGEISGFQLAKMLQEKESTKDIPIIFITAKNTQNDTLTGFHLGADDYISKPFSLQLVVARVRAVLRRTAAKQGLPIEPEKEQAVFAIDQTQKRILVEGNPIQLTRKEFNLVSLLLDSPRRVFSRDEIIDRVWPDDICITVHTIDVHMSRLKKKMGDYGRFFVNRQGFGYFFNPDA